MLPDLTASKFQLFKEGSRDNHSRKRGTHLSAIGYKVVFQILGDFKQHDPSELGELQLGSMQLVLVDVCHQLGLKCRLHIPRPILPGRLCECV